MSKMNYFRLRAENRHLEDEMRKTRREQELERMEEVTTVPSLADFNRRYPATPRWSAGIPTPGNSTPSSQGLGLSAANRKKTVFNQDMSISGVISPVRGELTPPWSPLPTEEQIRDHEEMVKAIIAGQAELRDLSSSSGTEEEDNHKNTNELTAGQSTTRRGAASLLTTTGPSVLGQTEEGEEERRTTYTVRVVETEVEPIMLEENEFIPNRRVSTRQPRKQPFPKKNAGKK